MKEFLKKYVYHVLTILLVAGSVWIATINSKTFDSPEQKVNVVKVVETMPGPDEQWKTYYQDSVNKASTIKERKERTKIMRKSDSVRRMHDSLFLDMVKRQTVQIEQMKTVLDNIEH